MPKIFRCLTLSVSLLLLVSAAPSKNPLLEIAALLNTARTEKEFFDKELAAWGKLYIGEATRVWKDAERAAYRWIYWRNALNSYFTVCSFAPDQFPASLADLRKSPLFPFAPYDTVEATPYDGDFLTGMTLPPEKQDPRGLAPEDKAEIGKSHPAGALYIYRHSEQEGESTKWTLGYVLVWRDLNSKANLTDVRIVSFFPESTEAQPLRCLTNQMVFYILGHYAVTGTLPDKPEDLEKKTALLNPAVWQDKKMGPLARRIWNALVAEGKKS